MYALCAFYHVVVGRQTALGCVLCAVMYEYYVVRDSRDVIPAFRKKHNPIASPKMRLFWLPESSDRVPGKGSSG